MKVTIQRTKMAMTGNFYAYDAVVPVSELTPKRYASLTYQISYGGQYFATFEDATATDAYLNMPKGWEKYMVGEAHRASCKVQMLELAKRVYSELADVAEWPMLWIELPAFTGGHDSHVADFVLTPAEVA